MYFVERWLGVSPDAGSGIFEACTILAVLIVISVFVSAARFRPHGISASEMSRGRRDRRSPSAVLGTHELNGKRV